MSRVRSLRMNDHFDRFIDERMTSEGYASAEAVVEAGLRLLEQQEASLRRIDKGFFRDAKPWTRETLAAAIQKGLDSGEAEELDIDAFFEEVLIAARHRS